MRKRFISYIFILCLALIVHNTFSQNTGVRYEIDAKRIGVNFYDKDALPRSREFIRLDSTYYVGWYFNGMFKYDRAADYLGYRNCIDPLRKALFLFERNYKSNLKEVLTPGRFSLAQSDFMEYNIKAAWTINRNRFILHKYSFLKNSVEENEQLALTHLYTALVRGDGNAVFYLALIHNYLMNIDSATLYYDI